MPATLGRDKGSTEEAQPGFKAFASSTTTLTAFDFGLLQVLEPQVEAAVFSGNPEFSRPSSVQDVMGAFLNCGPRGPGPSSILQPGWLSGGGQREHRSS